MGIDRTAKRKIIRKSYIRLVFVSMFVLLASSICSFIDNIVISQTLGARALAAVGYFTPVLSIIGASHILIVGTVILCGNYVGSGEQKKVNSLFTSVFATMTMIFLVFALVLIIFRNNIAYILGASGEAASMLTAYMSGFALSIMFSSLSSMLYALASYNNEINRTYVATAAMCAGNIILDLALAKPMGVFGIGLASAVSTLLSLLIMLPGFIGRSRAIYFEVGKYNTADVLEAGRRGLPVLLFTAGMVIKNASLNYSLNTYVGEDGIAIVNVLNSLCGVLGIVVGGCNNAMSSMASLYYGEEDKEAYIDVSRITVRFGLTCSAILVTAMIVFSKPLSHIFFEPGTNAARLCEEMFIFGFWFYLINLPINLLMNSYKVVGRMKLVNFISIIETALIGVIAILTVPVFGTKAAWLANTWSDIIALAILLISVFILNKKITLAPADLLKLPPDFGASGNQFVEYAIRNMQDVSAVSATVIDFCKSKGIDGKKSFWTGLCVEEVAMNVLKHGSFKENNNHINVRVVCKDGLTIRIADDCRKFDPRDYMKLYDKETPEKAIGLRMVFSFSSNIDYYNNAGINTLIIKI